MNESTQACQGSMVVKQDPQNAETPRTKRQKLNTPRNFETEV